MFNQNDVHNADTFTISSRDTLSEGERNKFIQNPTTNVNNTEKSESNSNLPSDTQPEPNKDSITQEDQASNTVPFPTASEPKYNAEMEAKGDSEQPQVYRPG